MDEVDIAQEREQGFINAALAEQKNKINRDRELREKFEKTGVKLHCKYCETELEGYDASYCDIECRKEYEFLQEALKRNGNI